MMRSAVITGVTSFVGFHLANTFARSGWRVLATHSRPGDQYAGIQDGRLRGLDAGVALRRLDIRDAAALAELVNEAAPSLWVHHAGYATGYASPDYDFAKATDVNVAPLSPLYAALAEKDCGVIVTGSSMEYAESDRANREDEACWPDTPYGLSKLGETLLARQLAVRYHVPTRVARLFIPFGTFDNPNKLLSLVATAMAQGKPVDLSPCEQRRDFTAVADICQGYLALAGDMSRDTFDVFNLCGGRAVALKALLLAMAQSAGRDPALLRFGAIPMRAGEPAVSFGDNGKASRLLGWQPRPAEQMVQDLIAV